MIKRLLSDEPERRRQSNIQFVSDLRWGMKSIARELGCSVRQAYHLHKSGRIPTFKCGKTVVARASELHARLSAQAADQD
jgi:hypothetical protein